MHDATGDRAGIEPRAGLKRATVLAPIFWSAAIGGCLLLLYPNAFPNYDVTYALTWAGDIWNGLDPDFGAPVAPTFHPLTMALALAVDPLGNAAGDLVVGISVFAFGVLVWSMFALGQTLFSRPVGVVAAVIVLASVRLEVFSVAAFGDISFAALVLLAATLEARTKRRGLPVLALLAVAGTLRPEAWLFAAAYWLYLFPERTGRERAGLALAALAGPLVWMGVDWAVAGNPFHAVGSTSGNADVLELTKPMWQFPYWMPVAIGHLTGLPALVGACAGIVFAVRHARDASVVPFALGVLGCLGFAILVATGQPVIGRYAIVPAASVAIFAGVGAFGALSLPPGGSRRLWTAIGAGVVVLFLALSPFAVGLWIDRHRDIERRGKIVEDLARVAQVISKSPTLASCLPIYVTNHRPVPFLRYRLGTAPGSVDIGTPPADSAALVLQPASVAVADRFLWTKPTDRRPLEEALPDEYRRVGSNASWTLYASPECLGKTRR